MIGIYAIFRKSDDKCMYVGQSNDLDRRLHCHFRNNFNNGEYYSKIIETFYFYDLENQLNREAYWINVFDPELNIVRNRHMPESSREKLRGRHLSDETRGKISDNNGMKNSDARRKVSEALKGRTFSEETRRKISEANKGKPSPRRGKKFGPMSEETKHKISEKLKGHQSYERTEEHKKKQSELHKGQIAWNKGLPKEKQPTYGKHWKCKK